MLQYLKKAVSGSHVQDPRNNLVRDEYRKKLLKDNLAQSIKKLQKAYVNSPSPVIERNDEKANKVCIALEAIFLHEYSHRSQPMDLKNMFVEGIKNAEDETFHISFWDLLKEVTHSDVITQLKHLVVTTEVGLCRSWIRLALNDCLIISYLDAILANKTLISRFYAPNAFMMDVELPFILKDLLHGLMNFEFRLNYNSSKLNAWEMEPLELAGIVNSNKKLSPDGEFINANHSAPTARLKDVTSHKTKRGEAKIKRSVSLTSSTSNIKGDSKVKKHEEPSVKIETPQKQSTPNAIVEELISPRAKITEVERLPIAKNSSFLKVQQERGNLDGSKTAHEELSSSKDIATSNITEKDTSQKSVIIKQKENNDFDGNSTKTLTLEEANQDSISTNPISDDLEKLIAPPRSNLLGNRLGGNGWSGWSSQFEEGDTEEDVNGTNEKEIKSFDSLLQLYGNKTETLNSVNESKQAETVQKKPFVSDAVDGDGQPRKSTGSAEGQPTSPTSPTADPVINQTFEIVPMDSSLQGDNVDKKTLSSLSQLTQLGFEIGLDKQNFQCKHCNKAIGLIYGPYRVCYFDGGYYCLDCHDDDHYYIPAKVIQQWDFRKYKVSRYNKVFLMKIEEEPLFHMDELNPKLYDHVMSLREVKSLRQKLQFVREYVQTCRHEVAEDFRIRLWPREYLCDDTHQYSLLDLIQVHNGQLSHHLKRVISQFTKHIYKCTLCRQKGFICEYCNDDKIIYPFEIDIAIQCQNCLSTFHRACRQDRRCPKCVRIHFRSQNTQRDDVERRLTVATKENIDRGVF